MTDRQMTEAEWKDFHHWYACRGPVAGEPHTFTQDMCMGDYSAALGSMSVRDMTDFVGSVSDGVLAMPMYLAIPLALVAMAILMRKRR